MASIQFDRVSKVFPNGYVAVRELTLETTVNERLVIVGPSGSGKSTVLRLIAGLESVTSGRILIDGRDVTKLPPQERDIAMVFQSYALYPHKSVRENLAFSLRLRGMSNADITHRISNAATMLGLEALLERRPGQLSGGQRQRVALGRAIVREPKAFLLDEPLSNLDPQLRVSTRAELALLHQQLGTTMVYVTHDQEEAMTLGTRIAVMRDGHVEQVAAPLELYRRPANTFVGGFVGSPAMNLLPCECSTSAERLQVRTPLGDLHIDMADTSDAEHTRAVTLGIRPHDVELTGADDADARGQIIVAEPLGAATLIHVRPERAPTLTVRAITPADHELSAGGIVGIRLRRDRLHLFDGAGVRVG